MSAQQRSGDVIQARFNGEVSGQAAVGKGITQTQAIGAGTPEVTEADRVALQRVLAGLRTQVAAAAPSDKQDAALERVDELGEAVTADVPDLSTMEYVSHWFVKHLPQVAGSVVGVVTNPIVGKLVEAAGEGLATDFRRRFGAGPAESIGC